MILYSYKRNLDYWEPVAPSPFARFAFLKITPCGTWTVVLRRCEAQCLNNVPGHRRISPLVSQRKY